MSAEHISSTIKALKEESARIQTQDKQAVHKINELISKLEADIHTEHPLPITDLLSALIESTEERYPRITFILNDLMMKFSNIGV